MTEEEQVLNALRDVVDDAGSRLIEESTLSTERALTEGEESIWKGAPMTAVFDFWVKHKVFQGSPEEVAFFKQEHGPDTNPNVGVVDASNGSANACLQVHCAYEAEPNGPGDIKELLSNGAQMIRMHDQLPNLAGLMIRTEAWASKTAEKDGVKPSEAEDKQDIVIIASILANRMMFRIRAKDTGEILETKMMKVKEFTGKNYKGIENQALELREEYGEVPYLLYAALYLPMMMRDRDPELFAALAKDASSSSDDGETTTPEER